ncbi:MAG: tetratricopeptide repeat protein [Chlorobi bacterium]|nr:tetratricopeptide repeat protein [Chlorobiota bacterium]
MKNILILSIIILTGNITFSQNNLPEQFIDADKLYAEGKFDKAAEKYEKLAAEGYMSPELFFNAGNAFYRLNKIGKAIYYYEKARMLNPGDEDINYNLEMARLRVKNLPPEVPEIFPVRMFKKIVDAKSPDFWGILSLSLFILSLILFFLYYTAKTSGNKKIRFSASAVTLFLFILSFTFFQYRMSEINSRDKAVTISSEITGKSSPDASAGDLFKIYEGYIVKIESKNGDWYEIKLSDGRKAWVKKDDLMIL